MIESLYRLLRGSHVQMQGIVDTLDQSLVVLDRDFIVSPLELPHNRSIGLATDCIRSGKRFRRPGAPRPGAPTPRRPAHREKPN
jgi:hypothetical protein